MYKSVIVPLAKEDILEAAKWYNKQQKGILVSANSTHRISTELNTSHLQE